MTVAPADVLPYLRMGGGREPGAALAALKEG